MVDFQVGLISSDQAEWLRKHLQPEAKEPALLFYPHVYPDTQMQDFFPSQHADTVYQFIRTQVLPELAWDGFDEMLNRYQSMRSRSPFAFVDVFPTLACIAAGGDAQQSVPLAAAWVLYLLSGRALDDLLDDEAGENDWCQGSPSLPIGLYTIGLANIATTQLADNDIAIDILNAFNKALALAARSEAAQLTTTTPSVAQYFRASTAKTGLIFATGAWAGGRLVAQNADDYRLSALYACGLNIGMMAQILDDCTDLDTDLNRGVWTLPVVHGLSQTEHPLHPELKVLLNPGVKYGMRDARRITTILTQMDSIKWSLKIGEVYQQRALEDLDRLSDAHTDLLVRYVKRTFASDIK